MFGSIGDLVSSVSGMFGGGEGSGGGLFSSPIFGNVLGAIGMELLRGDPVEEARKKEGARLDEIREHSYGFTGPTPTRRGLPTTSAPPRAPPPTAAKYLPGGKLV